MSACGAYAIRPYTGDLKNDDFFSIRPPVWPSIGRMLLRPYTGDLKNGDFSICSTTGVAVYGAYAVASYTEGRKPGWFLVRIPRRGRKGGGAWVVRKVG